MLALLRKKVVVSQFTKCKCRSNNGNNRVDARCGFRDHHQPSTAGRKFGIYVKEREGRGQMGPKPEKDQRWTLPSANSAAFEGGREK